MSYQAAIHLTRAVKLIEAIDSDLEDLRASVSSHMASADNVDGWEQVWQLYRNKGVLTNRKAEIVADIELAAQEIAKAVAADPEVRVDVEAVGNVGITEAMAVVYNVRGQTEMVWGTGENAKHYFEQSAEMFEAPFPYFMLGWIYQSEYKAEPAIAYYQKCLDLDPTGDLSVPALRNINQLKNYRKQFRGQWSTFWLLVVFFWPGAIAYFFSKRK